MDNADSLHRGASERGAQHFHNPSLKRKSASAVWEEGKKGELAIILKEGGRGGEKAMHLKYQRAKSSSKMSAEPVLSI